MKPNDAKAPKFDHTWWKVNKSKAADADGAFEKALARYEAEKARLFSPVTSRGVVPVLKALTDLKAQAAKTKADPKLGVLQKETKEALDSYAKGCDQALPAAKGLEKLAKLLAMDTKKLIAANEQSFLKYCQKEHSAENFNFLSIMLKSPKGSQLIYDEFVKLNSKFEINLPQSIRVQFDKIATGSRNWGDAPWPAAILEVTKMTDGIAARYRETVSNEMKKVKLP